MNLPLPLIAAPCAWAQFNDLQTIRAPGSGSFPCPPAAHTDGPAKSPGLGCDQASSTFARCNAAVCQYLRAPPAACCLIAATVATAVCDTVMTSSPVCTPHARSARISASVPLFTPTQCFTPICPQRLSNARGRPKDVAAAIQHGRYCAVDLPLCFRYC